MGLLSSSRRGADRPNPGARLARRVKAEVTEGMVQLLWLIFLSPIYQHLLIKGWI